MKKLVVKSDTASQGSQISGLGVPVKLKSQLHISQNVREMSLDMCLILRTQNYFSCVLVSRGQTLHYISLWDFQGVNLFNRTRSIDQSTPHNSLLVTFVFTSWISPQGRPMGSPIRSLEMASSFTCWAWYFNKIRICHFLFTHKVSVIVKHI